MESPSESLPHREHNRLCFPLEQGCLHKSTELGTSGWIYFEIKNFLQHFLNLFYIFYILIFITTMLITI